MPVAMSMLMSSFVSLVDGRFSYTIMAERVASAMDSFPFLAIPFFILAAEIMNTGGISDRIFNFAQAFVGHIQGGLGQVNVVASIIFSGMSGSSAADAAGLGAIEIKAMLKEGYDPGFSAAITAASSTIGPIFPPSIQMVLYGVMAQVSAGHLFAAGMAPGLLLGLGFMVTVALMARTGMIKAPGARGLLKEILATKRGCGLFVDPGRSAGRHLLGLLHADGSWGGSRIPGPHPRLDLPGHELPGHSRALG